MGTLKKLADRLSQLKVNQLHLYMEHAFVFSFDSEICGPQDGLTPDEIRELDRYCRDRFIDLVPAVATLGHMGRILSMPKYRHLAEIEASKTWGEMTWPERARGLTLDCMNPESHRLVERIWSEVLDAFSSPVVNICGDEPWDLGAGKNRMRFDAAGKAKAYVEHLRRTQRICANRGRLVQFWSDVIRNHAHLMDSPLREATVLHWGYDDRADYEGTQVFTESGANTFVCPGTSGWKRILNALNLAERNIATFAAAGKRHGATGLLNTDWGDHGHFNALACSWHGIALGAALGWDAEHPLGADFDARFSRHFMGTDDPTLVAALRMASRSADHCESWRLLWQPWVENREDPSWPVPEVLWESERGALQAEQWLRNHSPTNRSIEMDFEELSVACQCLELFHRRARFVRAAQPATPRCSKPSSELGSLSELTHQITKRFADCWNARNKPSGLGDILSAFAQFLNDPGVGAG